MLLYDGFDSHLICPVIDYCLDHKTIPFCLPAHTSHKTQPLDKSVFPPLGKKYGNLVNHTRHMIKKDRFPKTLVQARELACTKENAIAGWRGTGLYPFKPFKILKMLRKRPTDFDDLFPELKSDIPPTADESTAGPAQRMQDILEYNPPMPTSLEAIEKLYSQSVFAVESIPTNTVSVLSGVAVQKLLAMFSAWKEGCNQLLGDRRMVECGEEALREEIKDAKNIGSADTRYVAPPLDNIGKGKQKQTYAEILDHGSNLYLRRKLREEEDEQKEARKRVRATVTESNKENIIPKPFKLESGSCSKSQSLDTQLSKPEVSQFLFSRSSQLSDQEVSQLLTGNQFSKR